MRSTRFAFRLAVVATTPLCLGLLSPSGASGGTVFMKNGYIIQGPVVNNDSQKVVLGWPYGKVTIHRRFYDSVLLEPEEEAEIARRLAEEKETEEQLSPEIIEPDAADTVRAAEELPDFDDVALQLGIYGEDPLGTDSFETPSGKSPATAGGEITGVQGVEQIDGVDLGGDPGAEDPTGDPVSNPGMSGGTDGTGVEVAKVPGSATLARRQSVGPLECSVMPPEGWVRDEGEERVRWTGQPQGDAFLPSLVIVTGEAREWELEEARRSLREDPARSFASFDVLSEKEVFVGGRAAYQVEGRGTVAAGRQGGAQVYVRQILVPGDGRFWLISTFSSEGSSEQVLSLLEEATETIEFSTAAEGAEMIDE